MKSFRSVLFASLCVFAASAMAMTMPSDSSAAGVAKHKESLTNPAGPTSVKKVEGRCPTQKHFKITVYEDGVTSKNGTMNLYVYEGPLGKGKIPSKVSVNEAKAFVCKQNKEVWLPDDAPAGE